LLPSKSSTPANQGELSSTIVPANSLPKLEVGQSQTPMNFSRNVFKLGTYNTAQNSEKGSESKVKKKLKAMVTNGSIKKTSLASEVFPPLGFTRTSESYY
jgi:hypothetical protein